MKTYKRPSHVVTILQVTTLVIAALSLACGPCGLIQGPPRTPTPTSLPTATPTPTPIPAEAWTEEGHERLRRSDFAGAEAAYREAIAVDERYAPAYVGLSLTYHWQSARDDEALPQAQRAVELDSASAEAHIALALAYIGLEKTDEAVAAGEQAVALDEKSAIAHAGLSRAYLQDRQHEPARQAAERAIALDPHLAEAYYALGVFYSNTADFARARAAFERAAALEPEFAPWQAILGRFSGRACDYDQATTFYESALELSPNFADAITGLTGVNASKRNFAEAEALSERAIELFPDSPEVYVEQGYVYIMRNKLDEALDSYQHALQLDEDAWRAQEGIGYVYLRQEECESAERQFQAIVDVHPRFAAGWLGLGYAEICKDRARKALDYFRQALDLEPYNADVYESMGMAYVAREDWEEASTAYVQALRLAPCGATLHCRLGYTLWMQGDLEAAKAEARLAIRQDPYFVDAYSLLGSMCFWGEQYAEAQQYAEQAVALDESNWYSWSILGAALVLQGETEEGIDILERVVNEDTENGLAHLFLGLAYRDVGSYNRARRELEKCLPLTPSPPEQLEYLITALDEGYVLLENEAITDLMEMLAEVVEEPSPRIEVVEEEAGRTLVISISTAPGSSEQEIPFTIVNTAWIAALWVPRINPPVTNGMRIQVEGQQGTIYTARISFSDAKLHADGILNYQQFLGRIQVSYTSAAGGRPQVEALLANTAELRELSPITPLPYQYATPEELREHLPDASGVRTQQALHPSMAYLSVWAAIAPDANLADLPADLYTTQMTGFYDVEEKTLYLLEVEELTTAYQMDIANAYAHALLDQHFDLDALLASAADADQRRALYALVEGDATLTMFYYAAEHTPLFDREMFILRAGSLESDALAAALPVVRPMALFPYREGTSFTYALYESDGWEAVSEAYQNPPLSTEHILHPERYLEGDDPVPISLPDLAAELGGDWREIESGVSGELVLRLVLSQYLGPGAAAAAAEGWGGDRYSLLQQGTDGPHVLVLKTVWDTPEDAEEFWSLYQVYMAHRPGYTEDVVQLVGPVDSHWWTSTEGCVFITRQDNAVTIVIGPDRETVEQVVAALS